MYAEIRAPGGVVECEELSTGVSIETAKGEVVLTRYAFDALFEPMPDSAVPPPFTQEDEDET